MKKQRTASLKTGAPAQSEEPSDAREKNCPNCGHGLEHNFCPQCGQMKYRRINRNYIVEEVQNVVSATKGFFYTLRKLFINPGGAAREFIDGKRVNHFRPLYFVFVLTGFEALLAYGWVGYREIMEGYFAQQHIVSPFMHDFFTILASYHSFIMLLLLPVFALCTKLAFWKWGNNYYEHIVMNAYILSLHTLISMILIYPLMYVFRDQVGLAVQISSLVYLAPFFYLPWFFKGFYPDKSLKSIIGRVFLIMGIIIVIYILLTILMVIIGIAYVVINGSETVEYFRPQ